MAVVLSMYTHKHLLLQSDFYANFTVMIEPESSPIDDKCKESVLSKARTNSIKAIDVNIKVPGCPTVQGHKMMLTEDLIPCTGNTVYIPLPANPPAGANALCCKLIAYNFLSHIL